MAASDLIWYYQVAGETMGPFSSRQMIQFASEGTIDRFTLVRRDANGKWVSADSVKGFKFEVTDVESAGEFELASLPPVPPVPTVARPDPASVSRSPQPRRSRLTVDAVLFTWTRVISYFMIAGLLIIGLGYSIIFLINIRPPASAQTVKLAELRAAKVVAPSEDSADSHTTSILGVDIGPNLQRLTKAVPQSAETITIYLQSLEKDVQAATLDHLETFAGELENSGLKFVEKRRLLEKFLFEQPYRIEAYKSELQEKASARSDAVTMIFSAVGLSILVCLVLVLLGIERNTREAKPV